MSKEQIAEQLDFLADLIPEGIIFSAQSAIPAQHVKATLGELINMVRFGGGFWHVVIYYGGDSIERIKAVDLQSFTYIPVDRPFTRMNQLTRKMIK